jgi:YHS domain-containing protein
MEETHMINLRCIAVLFAVLVATTFASATEKTLVNGDANGVVLHGYDPVAYFTDKVAMKGDAKYKVTYNGGTFYFASDANKTLFEKEPAKYAPQYGGYCAVAVSQGKLEDADPKMFAVYKDQLFVQRNAKARQMFLANPDGVHQKADQQWRELVEKHSK